MEAQILTNIFTEAGLTTHEAAVYAASLVLGPASVLEIAQKAGLKRTTVYAVAESLQEKGLMSVEIKGLKRKFIAEHPSRLEQVLEARKVVVQSALTKFNHIFSRRDDSQSRIRYYQGLSGIKTIYNEFLHLLKPGDYYYGISNHEQWSSLDPGFFTDFVEKRAKIHKLDIRLLLMDSPPARKYYQFQKNFNQQVRIVPDNPKIHTLLVTPHRVVIHQLAKPTAAIVIENQSVIDMQKEIFEMLWKTTPA
jgi:sugar-specific transcriptional regulator TrmB